VPPSGGLVLERDHLRWSSRDAGWLRLCAQPVATVLREVRRWQRGTIQYAKSSSATWRFRSRWGAARNLSADGRAIYEPSRPCLCQALDLLLRCRVRVEGRVEEFLPKRIILGDGGWRELAGGAHASRLPQWCRATPASTGGDTGATRDPSTTMSGGAARSFPIRHFRPPILERAITSEVLLPWWKAAR
jgi:hypothetical protein